MVCKYTTRRPRLHACSVQGSAVSYGVTPTICRYCCYSPSAAATRRAVWRRKPTGMGNRHSSQTSHEREVACFR